MKYVFRTIEVNKNWIENKIEKPGWQRGLYASRVNFFINHIKNRTFRRSLITLARNQSNGHFILLDGQHKLEAIKATDSSFKMDCKLCEGMTEEEMMKEYISLNNVKLHRIIDDIKLHIGKNEILDSFLDEQIFPINVSLSGGINSIRIDRFLNVYKNGNKMTKTRANLSRSNLNEFLGNLTTDNFVLMKEFCAFYKACFGDPYRENWLYRNMVMFTIMKIWVKNKDYFEQKEMIKAFTPIIKSGAIQMESQGVDLVTQEGLTMKIYRAINKFRSKNKFQKFWVEDGEKE